MYIRYYSKYPNMMRLSQFISSIFFVFLILIVSKAKSSVKYEYEIKYLDVLIDHFSFADNRTFKLRYSINESYWDRNNGPIFFYTGNEGDIEMFAQNTGLMWDFAAKFNACLLFAEHRYYGDSMPFGNKSFTKPEYLGYLTSEQALADFVDVIFHVKNYDHKFSFAERKNAVIAFGGSYGGMLAAWMRMKYPAVIQGSLASSAPIWQFTGMIGCNDFNNLVSSVYNETSANCFKNIRQSWDVITKFTKNTANGKSWINENWKLCEPLVKDRDVEELIDWLVNVYVNIAMINYPYPSNFLMPVPANPLKELCKPLDEQIWSTDELLLKHVFEAVTVYFNYTASARCLDWSTDPSAGLGYEGWGVQSCNEMVMPMCANGITDMFVAAKWDLKSYSDTCYEQYKIRPRERMVEKMYGGKRIETASNIIFSNGKIDPWTSGGVTRLPSRYVHVFVLSKSAHHLDLRASNKNDPPSVRKARNIYKTIFKNWISLYKRGASLDSMRETLHIYEGIDNDVRVL